MLIMFALLFPVLTTSSPPHAARSAIRGGQLEVSRALGDYNWAGTEKVDGVEARPDILNVELTAGKSIVSISISLLRLFLLTPPKEVNRHRHRRHV